MSTEKEKRFKVYEMMSALYHELAPGEHTYHLCEECRGRPARREKCYACLVKEMNDEILQQV